MTLGIKKTLVLGSLVAVLGLALTSVVAPTATAARGKDGSGGKATAHHPGGRKVGGAAARKAPVSKLFHIGMPSGEPTIGATRSGAVFTSAIQSNTRVEVVRSKNGGKKWDVVSPTLPNGRNAQLLSFDPYTYVDNPADRDFSRMFTLDLTVACSWVSFTDDDGETWTTNPVVCGRPVNDHQTLFGGPPAESTTVGYPNIIYYCWNDVATSSCQKSLDGGISFTVTGTPAYPGVDPDAGGGLCGGLHGHGHVDRKGNVYLPKGHCGQPWLAISRDEGRTWERVQVAKNGTADHEAGVATDRKGNIYYTYIGADRLPYLVYSRNGGKKWSKPMMIGAPRVNEANIPSIDVGGVGKVAVAYMGTENGPGQPFENDDYSKTTWNGYIMTTGNALAKRPVLYSATVNDKKDPINRGRCGPGRCNTIIYDFIDVHIDLEGRVWSAWVDACTSLCVNSGPQNLGNEGVVGLLVGGPKMR